MKRYSSATRALWRMQHRRWRWLRERTQVNLSVKDIQKVLAGHGFPVGTVDGVAGPMTEAAVRRFQNAFNGGKARLEHLVVDGKIGPKTRAAVWELPYLSEHFTALECASKGNGDAYVRRELLQKLELLRAELGRSLYLVSVYRDAAHNKRVGGATRSLHLFGMAADFSRSYNYRLARAKESGWWGGIGALGKSQRVTHVDVREGGPRVWFYPE